MCRGVEDLDTQPATCRAHAAAVDRERRTTRNAFSNSPDLERRGNLKREPIMTPIFHSCRSVAAAAGVLLLIAAAPAAQEINTLSADVGAKVKAAITEVMD